MVLKRRCMAPFLLLRRWKCFALSELTRTLVKALVISLVKTELRFVVSCLNASRGAATNEANEKRGDRVDRRREIRKSIRTAPFRRFAPGSVSFDCLSD